MDTSELREYGPFNQECEKRGIRKTQRYEVRKAGLLEVFYIGNKPFVYIDSLLTLPQRLLDSLSQNLQNPSLSQHQHG